MKLIALATALSLVAPAFAAPGPPPQSHYADWARGCEPIASGTAPRCYVYQSVALNQSDEVILKAVAGRLTDDPAKLVMIITAPLGVYLPAGLTLEAEGAALQSHAFLTCDPKGCRAVIELTAPLLAALRQGNEARVTVLDGRQEKLEVPLSLDGFAAALASL